jgi:hypothetical protein
MAEGTSTGYSHTQRGPWWLLLYSFGLVILITAWTTAGSVPAVSVILVVSGAMMLLFGASFQHLTVADEGDRLAIRFGPVPLFARRIRYEDIQGVEPGRTTLLDGWGSHYSTQGGWVWNIRGRDCVEIRHGATTFVGTDDQENLLRFLRAKLPSTP